jgi:hypothetical protein
VNALAPRRVVARNFTFPVATGGWNAIDALDAMKPDEAETLINWFPETTYNRLRRGYIEFCDIGGTLPVTALAAYNGVTDELLAFCDDTWYEVTTGTAASLATGFTATRWDSVNFATAAGQYLVTVNGADTPQVYDGATMVAAVNTVGGAPSTLLLNRVCNFNQRLYFAEKDSLSIWYLPVGVYQGALTEFDIGPLCTKGGSIAKIATWTRDNAAAGANEMLVIVTDQGEVFVYIGDYPGGVWNLSAKFSVGEPVAGVDSVVKLGPDCILIGEDGFQPMAHYLQLGQSQAQAVAISRKIGNAVTAAVRASKTEAGWQGLLYPRANMLVFNIPQGSGVFYQFVVNTLTGAWCQWQGQNAYCWALHIADPYFGGADGKVYIADSGTSDNGADIVAEYRGSYQYVGGEALIKRVSMARPVFQTTGPITVAFGVDVDFNNTSLTAPVSSLAAGSLWGSAVWGTGVWGSGLTLQNQWVSVGAMGYAMAPHMIIQTGSIQCNLMNIGLIYERGAFI